MSNFFHIRIIATDKIFFEGKVIAFIGSSLDGEFEFMAHHEEEIVAITVGGIRYQTEDGEWHRAVCGMGTAQFVNNRCSVLVDTCEKPEDIDRVRAQAALERAQEGILHHSSKVEYYMAQASMVRAIARLKESYDRRS